MLFSRQHRNVGPVIAEFWRWWPGVRPRVEAAIADGTWSDDLIAEVSGRVKAIDRELEWEFAQGTRSGHALVVSAAGAPRLRAVAERWRRAAPAADDRWEYHSTRQPDPTSLSAALTVSGHEIKLTELRFACRIDPDRYEVDVLVHHPDFGRLGEPDRMRVAFLALDWLLGEVAVELWVGGVEVSTTLPPRTESGEALTAVVAQLARRLRETSWVLLERAPVGGSPQTAAVRHPLKPVRWPHLDTHLGVVVPYRAAETGLPTETALVALERLEEQIAAAASGAVLVAHESCAGRRTFHLYAEAGASPLGPVRDAVRGWDQGRVRLRTRYDPGWQAVRPLCP
ncbi:DUF695 domain-containing protein [Micromonospora sp. NBC_01796]|uniref:DUF695 domain-containing protein n=1 Tax=Micromonospora sp. NBC_01796 TaxID=2975987 RepID=UPI002DD85D42|nr:DUF695 domain-containing protein [Micromonospora sp. NBC_01796]WSA89388.1 DUF695 domain-containing protein [Micromonospora sp. NBC_01796]